MKLQGKRALITGADSGIGQGTAERLAREGADVAPGLIETPMTSDRFENPNKLAQSLERIPWRRAGQPDEIANGILYLASDEADDVTGHTLAIDGGLTRQWGGA